MEGKGGAGRERSSNCGLGMGRMGVRVGGIPPAVQLLPLIISQISVDKDISERRILKFICSREQLSPVIIIG